MTDVPVALRLHFLADPAIAALCSTRVYAYELPPAEDKEMPRPVVVIVTAGGIERAATDPIVRPRLDIYSYGETMKRAADVDRAVYDALKALVRTRVDEVLLHSVALSGGPYPLRDGDGRWPVQWRSVTVAADERQIEE